MNVGLFGGAFDPPHRGHVELVRRAKEELGLDEVVVLVAADPGHKRVETPADVRLEMARAAFPGDTVLLDSHPRTFPGDPSASTLTPRTLNVSGTWRF